MWVNKREKREGRKQVEEKDISWRKEMGIIACKSVFTFHYQLLRLYINWLKVYINSKLFEWGHYMRIF